MSRTCFSPCVIISNVYDVVLQIYMAFYCAKILELDEAADKLYFFCSSFGMHIQLEVLRILCKIDRTGGITKRLFELLKAKTVDSELYLTYIVLSRNYYRELDIHQSDTTDSEALHEKQLISGTVFPVFVFVRICL